jgi:hypothetical protein
MANEAPVSAMGSPKAEATLLRAIGLRFPEILTTV